MELLEFLFGIMQDAPTKESSMGYGFFILMLLVVVLIFLSGLSDFILKLLGKFSLNFNINRNLSKKQWGELKGILGGELEHLQKLEEKISLLHKKIEDNKNKPTLL